MTDDLDLLALLRKYQLFDNLKKRAADEIERLTKRIAELESEKDSWYNMYISKD